MGERKYTGLIKYNENGVTRLIKFSGITIDEFEEEYGKIDNKEIIEIIIRNDRMIL